jgi:hypothetical protein
MLPAVEMNSRKSRGLTVVKLEFTRFMSPSAWKRIRSPVKVSFVAQIFPSDVSTSMTASESSVEFLITTFPQASSLRSPLLFPSVSVAVSISIVAPASHTEPSPVPASNWIPRTPSLVIEPPAGPSTLIEWAMIRTPSVPAASTRAHFRTTSEVGRLICVQPLKIVTDPPPTEQFVTSTTFAFAGMSH